MAITPGMRETTEVRWFGRGRPPASVVDWMRDLDSALEERVDVYLRVSGCAGVGIKMREGMLEVKGRGQAEVVRIGAPPVVGLLERWRKWTSDSATEMLKGTHECIVQVPKRRLRVGIESARGSWALVPPGRTWDGAVEVTELGVDARGYWTVAVELFRWAPAELLADAALTTMSRFPWEALTGLPSQGYAEFLDQHATSSRADPAQHGDAGRWDEASRRWPQTDEQPLAAQRTDRGVHL